MLRGDRGKAGTYFFRPLGERTWFFVHQLQTFYKLINKCSEIFYIKEKKLLDELSTNYLVKDWNIFIDISHS